MWVAAVAVPVRTVGTVCTHPDYRARGIGRTLMGFADEVRRAEEVVLSRLHTSVARWAFYGRCGYVKAIQDWSAA